MLNVLCIIIVTVAINTYGYAYFGLSQVPDWARRLIATQAPPLVENSTGTMLNDSFSGWWSDGERHGSNYSLSL
jgi:hypothetical protein